MSDMARLFSTPAIVEVLSLFLLHPDDDIYQVRVVRETEFALMQVQRALKRLEESGFIIKSTDKNRVYYRANRAHPAFEDIKHAFFKTVIFGDLFKACLKPLKHKVSAAFLFGSIARGQESKESDIDLFLIGNLTLRELAKLVGPIQREIGREINAVIYPSSELQRKIEEKNPFLYEVLTNPKIWLIGDENALINRRKIAKAQNIQRRNSKPSKSRRTRFGRRRHFSTIN